MINIKTKELAKKLNGRLIGSGDLSIFKLNKIADAQEGELTFLGDSKYLHYLKTSNASCVLIKKEFESECTKSDVDYIVVDNPHESFVKLMMEIAASLKETTHSISDRATIAPSVSIGNNVTIEPGVVIGENCKIADNTVIRANTTLYKNVSIGENTCLNSNITIYNDTIIGDNCIIHAGTVIGADGFGYIENPDGSFIKVPQLGNVVIYNDVEIGANCTIDRAMIGSTVIKSGVKLDNLVHVAHNCEIGENTASAAQTGISGSAIIGKRVRLGGQVGLAGHLTIADDVVLLAQSGVAKTIDKKGTYFGAPAKSQLQAFKIEAVIRHLPELLADLRDLQKKVKNLESSDS